MNLVWFRNDLRVDDNPALYNAMADEDNSTAAIYLLCGEQWNSYGIGNNQQALIIKALQNLREQLRLLNVPLLIVDCGYFSNATKIMAEITTKLGVTGLFFNQEYPLDERQRDKQVASALLGKVDCHRFNGQSLIEPWKVVNGSGSGYKVFSPFARAVHALLDREPLHPLDPPKAKKKSNFTDFEKLHLADEILTKELLCDELPTILPDVDCMPEINEKALAQQLHSFCSNEIAEYSETRDFPSILGTSNLSAAFAVGALSVRRCFVIAKQLSPNNSTSWINELIWRDFYRSVVWHFPRVCKHQAFNPVDKMLQWNSSKKDLNRWKTAQTGIPIIDAAITQLLKTGWMHNRLRMVVASYLTKNLWIDWRQGEQFFAQHLFDYDFASNNGGWQWSASTGTDAAPYFRVFNPASQQKRFDPDALFIKQWLPQLAEFSPTQLHKFETVPLPGYFPLQVDLKFSRKLAIEAFKNAKESALAY